MLGASDSAERSQIRKGYKGAKRQSRRRVLMMAASLQFKFLRSQLLRTYSDNSYTYRSWTELNWTLL